jgi:type I restriction enzyme R subunit
MPFNENSRVKIPALLHLCRLGYAYLPLAGAQWDVQTNIFTGIFKQNFLRLNPAHSEADFAVFLEKLNVALDNEDLGKAFYEMLTDSSGPVLVDFDNFRNNDLRVVTELPCINGDEEFRPVVGC